MSLLVSWVLFPLVLVLAGAGWGAVVEFGVGRRLNRVLLVPLGMAAMISFATLLTTWETTAPATIWLVAAVGVAGLVRLVREGDFPSSGRVPLLVAAGVFLLYGAPVLLSGHATFAGYHLLDDTAVWLGMIDRLMTHGRSVAGVPNSTYELVLRSFIDRTGFPTGALVPVGIGRGLVGADAAWVYQPYLALCGAFVGLGIYALVGRLVAGIRLRALVALVGAQPALLYGYSLFGGNKELTAAFLLVLAVVLTTEAIERGFSGPRELLPVTITVGAFIATLGPGGVVWAGPLLGALAATWLWRAQGAGAQRTVLVGIGWLAGLTAVFSLSVVVVLRAYVNNQAGLYAGTLGFKAASKPWEALGTLMHPLSALQLLGIWPTGDFRMTPSKGPTALLLLIVVAAAGVGLWTCARRRSFAPLLYVAVALVGCAGIALAGGSVGGSPWLIAKTLAIGSPALLVTALIGGAALSVPRRAAGLGVLGVIAAGVLWSNVLAYHDAQLAPRARLAELRHVNTLIAGHGPTLVNEDEEYATRHFLRDGVPIGTADYRQTLQVPLRDGQVLSGHAWTNLDSYAPAGVLPFRSIVVRRSPVESRPPSVYRLTWQGVYYQLWQRPVSVPRVLAHLALGDTSSNPYCGHATTGADRFLCPTAPAAVVRCSLVHQLARRAAGAHAELVAYQEPAPIVAFGPQLTSPSRWLENTAARTLTPTGAGRATVRFRLFGSQHYEIWLGGSFGRGFQVSVDGRRVGQVKNELAYNGQFIDVAGSYLSAGIHAVEVRYPSADLGPGTGGNHTWLSAVVLQPLDAPRSQLIATTPQHAGQLCGRILNWVELVANA